jgi:hypothetical protein
LSRSKFTESTRAALLDALRGGVPIRTACALVGVDKSQFYRWMSRGETARPGGVFHRFYLDVQHAIAVADSEAVLLVRRGMRDDPKLAWRWIQARLREDFGELHQPVPEPVPVRIQLSFGDGTPLRLPPTLQPLPPYEEFDDGA